MPITVTEGGISYQGPQAVAIFRAITIKQAIRFYVRTGMKVAAAYTPTAMLKVAGQITGNTYKRGQLQTAHDDLEQWIDAARAALNT